ncbi:DUF6930 domain-containing protein [uncultured Clostridium sp.]|uniref:DUF7309 domain-containing protein n=1 Tax=uncultured Clostridium sp. TaxID=59620 RepID=UPI00262D5E5D|nr:hypothetical protein [uncultured Clostridium sp.]
MRIEANLKEWKELYDIAIKLKELKPWEKLYDMDLITIMDKETNEPCICSMLGKQGDMYGIAAYDGKKQMEDFFELLENVEVSEHQLIRYQNCLMCNLGDKEDLTEQELKIIKDLGFNFKGENNYIYFRSYEKNFVDYMLTSKEVIRFTKILTNLYNALIEYNKGLDIDFEKGKTLMYAYNMKNKVWEASQGNLIVSKKEHIFITLDDKVLIHKLKKIEQSEDVLELDIAYLGAGVIDAKYRKPIIPKRFLLASNTQEVLCAQELVQISDSESDIIFDGIVNYIFASGRPKTIIVRDDYIASIIVDLCTRIGVEVAKSPELPVIDSIVERYLSMNS